MNVEEIFGGIDLPCNLELRIINTIDAHKSLDKAREAVGKVGTKK